MAITFGNVGGNVRIETMAGRDIIQQSSLQAQDKQELEGLSRQLDRAMQERPQGWQETAENVLKQMIHIGKDVAIKVAVAVISKRIGG